MFQKLKDHTLIKISALLLCLPLPTVIGSSLLSSNLWNIFPVNDPYVYLSFGFYGCLLACLLWKNLLLKAAMILLNALPAFFVFLGALMGGPGAIPVLLLTLVIPFIPWIRLL